MPRTSGSRERELTGVETVVMTVTVHEYAKEDELGSGVPVDACVRRVDTLCALTCTGSPALTNTVGLKIARIKPAETF